MPEEKYGLSEVKDVFTFLFTTGEIVEKCLKDGDWDWLKDSISLAPALVKLPNAVNDLSLFRKQVLDLSDEEIVELKLWMKEEFNLEDDELEGWIDDGVELLFVAMKFFGRFSR